MLKLPSDQQHLLEVVARLAAHDPVVGARVPDLVRSIARLVERLTAAPAKVALTDPRNGAAIELMIGPLDLQLAIADRLRGPETLALLPDLIARLEAGDWLALGVLVAAQLTGPVPSMMGLATDCASGASPSWRQRIAREATATVLGDAINVPMPEVCAHLPITALDDAFRTNPRTSVPVLAISGTLDGRTPPSGAARVIAGMSHARQLIIDGAGHGDALFVSSPRITEIMLRFLRGELRSDEHIALPPLRFIPVRTAVALDAATRSRLAGDYRASDGAVWHLVDAGSLLYLVRPGREPLALRASSPSELFPEGHAAAVRLRLDDGGRPVSLSILPDGVTEGPSAIAVR
jgi:pimeloyl-ACP methyl ester carboxylesterase